MLAVLAGLPVVGAGAAFAQSGDGDMRAIGNRLDRIENEISDLQRQSYGALPPGRLPRWIAVPVRPIFIRE